MSKSIHPALKYDNGFAITASDTVNIAQDAGNTEQVGAVYLHNVAAGATVRVLPAAQTVAVPVPITIYIPQGGYSDIAVKRVYATSPVPPAGLIGMYAKSTT